MRTVGNWGHQSERHGGGEFEALGSCPYLYIVLRELIFIASVSWSWQMNSKLLDNLTLAFNLESICHVSFIRTWHRSKPLTDKLMMLYINPESWSSFYHFINSIVGHKLQRIVRLSDIYEIKNSWCSGILKLWMVEF